MDKITRIHLAKVPYEISINAQEELKAYLEDIRKQLDGEVADETMTDIEVRITEILQERNINKDGVITAKDIEAIKTQLGSPEQFDDGEPRISKKNQKSLETKKLLRDTDNGLIGGVASGLGAYFRVDPVFVRIAFIVVTLFWGFGILIYLLLWLMVPPALTASDKLRMRGEPVTAAALQRYRDGANKTIENLRLRSVACMVFKVARIFFTICALIFILAVLIFMGMVSATLYTQPLHSIYVNYHLNFLLLGLLWLFIMVSIGLVIVLLLRLWQKRNNLLKPACFTLLGIMIVTIAGISILTPFVASHYKNLYGGDRLSVNLPIAGNNNVQVTSLNLLASRNLDVNYVVTSQPVHATYQAYPGMGHPNINISSSNGAMSVNATNLYKVTPDCVLDWCRHIYLPVKLTLYGPAVQNINVNNGAELNISSLNQQNLSVTTQNFSMVNIDGSYIQNLNATSQSNSSIDLSSTSSQVANINADSNGFVFGPNTNSLNFSFPTVCSQPMLELQQDPATATLNKQSATVLGLDQNSCVTVDNFQPIAPKSP